MNKKELYRSIERISQDRYLKERILKAAEEKDEVSVIKRPVFVPVLIAMLILLNAGLFTKLVILDKSHINLTEFKPRSSMNGVLSDSTENTSDNKSENVEGKETDELRNKSFDEIKSEFLKEISVNTYLITEEWNASEDYNPQEEAPFYLYSEYHEGNESYGYTFRRFVQVIDYNEFEYSEAEGESNGYTNGLRTAYTNHEYIVGYDGNSFEGESIISITESNTENQQTDASGLSKASSLTTQPLITDKLYETGNKIISKYVNEDIIDSEVNVYNLYYMFPLKETGCCDYIIDNVIYKCSASVNLASENGWKSEYFYLNTLAEDVTESLSEIPYGYWKDTVSAASEEKSEMVEVPDIVGIQFSDAKKVIENAGLKIGGITYIPQNNIAYNINDIVDSSLNPGDIVYRNTEIYIKVFGKMMPDLQGCSIEDALELLNGYDIKINTEYEYGADETGYVDRFTPPAGTSISEVESVTLYIAGNS